MKKEATGGEVGYFGKFAKALKWCIWAALSRLKP
jgi:hypothetical protein